MNPRQLMIGYLEHLCAELAALFESEEMDYYELKFTPRLKEPALLGFGFDSCPVHKEEQRTYEIREAIERFPRLLVLGEPGTGKTTALRWVALQYAQVALRKLKSRGASPGALIPVLASLVEYQVLAAEAARPDQSKPDCCLRSLLSMSFFNHLPGVKHGGFTLIDRLLRGHQAIVLLDAFNEIVDHEARCACAGAIRTFLANYPGLRCVLSSRKYRFDANLFKRGNSFSLKPLEVEELGKREILRFLKARRLTDTQVQLFFNQADTKLRQLAQNPLLLSFLARTLRGSGRLPRGKGMLFSEFILGCALDHPCQIVDVPRRDQSVDRQSLKRIKHDVCVDVAAQMQVTSLTMSDKDINQIAQQHGVEYDLRPSSVLQELRDNGILCVQNVGNATQWRFKYQAYQEYFAACCVAAKWLSHDYDAIGEYIRNAQWHEALAMAVGIIEGHCVKNGDPAAPAMALVNYIKGRGDVDSIILACKCIAGMENVEIREISDFAELLHRSFRSCLPLFARFGHYLVGLVLTGWLLGLLLVAFVVPVLPSLKYLDPWLPATIAYFLIIPSLALRAYNTRFDTIGRQIVERDILPTLVALRYMALAVPEARWILMDLARPTDEGVRDQNTTEVSPERKLEALIRDAVARAQYKPIWDEADLVLAVVNANPEAVTMARYLVHQGVSEDVFCRLLEYLESDGPAQRRIAGDTVEVLCRRDPRCLKLFEDFVLRNRTCAAGLSHYLQEIQRRIGRLAGSENRGRPSLLQQVICLTKRLLNCPTDKALVYIVCAALALLLGHFLLKLAGLR